MEVEWFGSYSFLGSSHLTRGLHFSTSCAPPVTLFTLPWLCSLEGQRSVPPVYIIIIYYSVYYMQHPACTHLVLMAFNPLTGSAGGLSPTCLPDIIQALLLSKEDHTHSKIILFLTRELEVVSYPSSHDVISHLTELDEQLFFFVADKRKGVMDGYFINNERTPSLELISFHTSHLWHITFPSATERILSIVHKAMNGNLWLGSE